MAIKPAEADGRVPCSRCGRCFAPDRIAKHQFICAGLKHGPPRKPQVVPRVAACNVRTETGPSAAAFTVPHSGRPGVSRRGSSKWRHDSNAFREAIRAARGARGGGSGGGVYSDRSSTGAYSGGRTGSSRFEACPHCGRTFAPTAWERHVAKCASIVNRPAPPPSTLGTPLGRGPAVPASCHSRTPLEASRSAASSGMARDPLARPPTDRHCPSGMRAVSSAVRSSLDEIVFAPSGALSRASAPSRAPPSAGSFARASSRCSCSGANPETRPSISRSRAGGDRIALQSGARGGSGSIGSWGAQGGMRVGGMGGLGGGGGIDTSNRTSANNPLASMVSHQGAYQVGGRR